MLILFLKDLADTGLQRNSALGSKRLKSCSDRIGKVGNWNCAHLNGAHGGFLPSRVVVKFDRRSVAVVPGEIQLDISVFTNQPIGDF